MSYVLALLLSFVAVAKINFRGELEAIKAKAASGQRKEALAELEKLEKTPQLTDAQKNQVNELAENIATVFYSDNGQKLYEKALALLTVHTSQARALLQEAEQVEPYNRALLQAQIQVELFDGKCRAALAKINLLDPRYQMATGVEALNIQALLCVGDIASSEERLKELEKKPTAALPHAYLAAKLRLSQNDFAGVEKWLLKFEHNQTDFPEVEYLKWRSAKKTSAEAAGAANKYLQMCQDIGPKIRRKYFWEPRICGQVVEVEAERQVPKESIGENGNVESDE